MKNIILYILIITILTSLYFEFYKNNQPNKLKEEFNSDNNSNNNNTPAESIDEINIDIYAELIELDPKYDFDKIEIKDGKILKTKDYDWEKRFLNEICNDKCGCIKENNNLCSYKIGSNIYQCPSFCPTCNKCHFMEKSSLEEKYESMCSRTSTLTDKEKCQKYEELLRISKSYCFFRKSKNQEIIKDNKNCDIYNSITNINYYHDSDILLRLTFYYQDKDFKKIDNVSIDNISIGKNKKEFNIFYKTNKEIYLFVKTDIRDIKNLQELIIDGKIFFVEENKEKVFNKKLIVSIIRKQEDNKKPLRDYIQKSKIKKDLIDSSEVDKYQLNYLEDSIILNKYPVNNHLVKNEVKNRILGEFKRENMIDNPTTWIKRADIARPWISTG